MQSAMGCKTDLWIQFVHFKGTEDFIMFQLEHGELTAIEIQ